jgi:hypothetical protein
MHILLKTLKYMKGLDFVYSHCKKNTKWFDDSSFNLFLKGMFILFSCVDFKQLLSKNYSRSFNKSLSNWMGCWTWLKFIKTKLLSLFCNWHCHNENPCHGEFQPNINIGAKFSPSPLANIFAFHQRNLSILGSITSKWP